MKRIGITGTIGSGKSFVGSLLRELGYAVLDADRKVHELYRDDRKLRAEMECEFGSDILTAEGVNRKALADRIFTDPLAQKKLESIVYPHLTAAVQKFFEECAESAKPLEGTGTFKTNEACFLEAALLARVPETVSLLDEIWIVDAHESLRLTRLQNRGLSMDDARRRIENQRGGCNPSLFPGKTVKTVINDSDRDCLLSRIRELL